MVISRSAALARLAATPVAPDESASWTCQFGPLTFRFPNFSWRRRAIVAHDLHHAMTDYPMTMRGEFQIAACEFGAGRYPHWGATLFCMPLILIGLLWSPRRMRAAFRAGRQTKSLYAELTNHDASNPEES